MATAAVITAAQETQPENRVESDQSRHARKRASAFEGLAALAFFAFAFAIGALFPRIRHFLWNMLGPCVVILAGDVVRYLREFHPSVLPSVLEYGSPLRVRLGRVKKALGWMALGATVLGLAAGLSAALGANCSCDDHPILFIAWATVELGSCLGFFGVAAYLGLRTAKPRRPVGTASYWPRAPRPISEYKPFHSEHWGRSSDSSVHKPQTTLVPQ
jgi:hypothetical protein